MSTMTPDLNVKVDATTTGYEAGIARAQRATQKYDADLARLHSDLAALEKQLDDDIAAALHRQHDAMDKAGRAALVFGGGVAVALGLAANEAIKWESAWAGVTKTVDGSASQMAALEEDLRSLATTLPATHEEIAAVAEAAGQLGVRREDVASFTKVMIDLSETTNLTADQAATDMARLANIMQTPTEEVDRLGAALVALGNDGASTEADILSMAMRIAGAGRQLGLTEGEVMGIANALSSVGIEAEAGGSSISTVMKKIQKAVSEGGGLLEGWAETAGMSAEEFSQLWGTNAAQALDAVVVGLGNVSASGGDVIGVLDQLGIEEIRQSDALLRLAGAGDLLTESLELGNQAWSDNSALVEEAAKRYETTEAKMQVARNTLRDAAITAGEVLLPAIAAVATTTGHMLQAWSDLPGPLKTGTVIVAALAAAIALVGGAALIAVPKIAAFKTAVAGLEAGALKTAGTRLIGLGSIITGPWGLALAAGVTALGFFAAKQGEAADAVEALKATLDEQTGALTDNSREWAIKELSDSGALETAKRLGIDLAVMTDAALGDADALAAVNEQLAVFIDQTTSDPRGLTDAGMAQLNEDATGLQETLNDTNGVLGEARTQWELEAEAKGSSAEASGEATAAQQGTTGAWEEGAAAAGELVEEVKTLQELFDELSSSYLNNRSAGRQVRDNLRGIREAIKEYRKEHGDLVGAFKDGTASGDEFAGLLDDLATSYQEQVNATADLTGSQRKTMEVYRESKAELIKVAEQLGLTKEEARKYAREVLGTPEIVRTYFETPGLQAANTEVQTYASSLEGLPRRVQTEIITVRSEEWRSGGNRGSGTPQANGGIRQAFADGGLTGSGQYVARVPQIMRGGADVRWAELETGWEAYISGKPGMGERNRAVWAEAGRRLGMGGGGGAVGIDYAQLASALERLRPPAPLYGDVHMQPHNYGDFQRQMLADQQAASLGGRRP